MKKKDQLKMHKEISGARRRKRRKKRSCSVGRGGRGAGGKAIK